MTRSFEDLITWQKAHEFVVCVYRTTATFPQNESFGLTSQFRRAAVSIAANIAEGYKKISKADKLRFFNISQGSIEECRYYIRLAFDLNYINEEVRQELQFSLYNCSKFLNSYCQGVINNNATTN